METIFSMVADQALERPDSEALIAPGRATLTYRHLVEHVYAVRRALRASGIRPRDRVALLLPDGPDTALTLIAVASSAVAAPINAHDTAAELGASLQQLGACALVMTADADPRLRRVAEATGMLVLDLCPVGTGDIGDVTLRCSMPAVPVAAAADPRADDLALLLHTSGTTARPKIVPFTHRILHGMARSYADALGLTPHDRCLETMPLIHTHGIYALLAALAGGGSVACMDGFDARRFFDWLDDTRPTWYTAVPTVHQAILACGADLSIPVPDPPLRFIRSSASHLPDRVKEDLRALFSAPVVETYGLTEASLVTLSRDGASKPGSVGRPAGRHMEVVIADAHGLPVAVGERGEIAIRGDDVIAGYDGDSEATAAAFRTGWFRTGDEGHLDADGYLFITGRLKELINRGGEKVSPREIDEALLAHSAVAQAAAFGVPHLSLGELVAAAVVLRAGSTTTEGDLLHFVADRLAGFKVPYRVLIVPEIPKGPTGKVQRRFLGTHFAEALARTPDAFVLPRTPTQRRVAEIWEHILGVTPIGLDDNFFDLGGDSLRATLMTVAVEAALGRRLELHTLLVAPTVEGVAAALDSAGEAGEAGRREREADALLTPVRATGSRAPLFFLHQDYSHDGVYCGALARALGPDRPFYALAPHGSHGTTLPDTVEDMAADYVARLRAVAPRGPYALGGFCAGGTVAYEMARQLRDAGETVEAVVMLNGAAKNADYLALHRFVRVVGDRLNLPPVTQRRVFVRLRRYLARARLVRRLGLRASVRRVRVLGRWSATLSVSAASDHAHDGIRDPAAREAYARFPAVTAVYIPRRYDGRVLLCTATTDNAETTDDPTLGWGHFARDIAAHPFPDYQNDLVTTHVDRVAEYIRRALNE